MDSDFRLLCPATGKQIYSSSESAKRARKRHREAGPREQSIRAYFCAHCEAWHNSSVPHAEAQQRLNDRQLVCDQKGHTYHPVTGCCQRCDRKRSEFKGGFESIKKIARDESWFINHVSLEQARVIMSKGFLADVSDSEWGAFALTANRAMEITPSTHAFGPATQQGLNNTVLLLCELDVVVRAVFVEKGFASLDDIVGAMRGSSEQRVRRAAKLEQQKKKHKAQEDYAHQIKTIRRVFPDLLAHRCPDRQRVVVAIEGLCAVTSRRQVLDEFQPLNRLSESQHEEMVAEIRLAFRSLNILRFEQDRTKVTVKFAALLALLPGPPQTPDLGVAGID
jgi:hypothetical protein